MINSKLTTIGFFSQSGVATKVKDGSVGTPVAIVNIRSYYYTLVIKVYDLLLTDGCMISLVRAINSQHSTV